MKILIANFLLAFALSSFLFIGLILLTGHAGIAIKLTNYLFFAIFLIIVFKIFTNA